MLQQAFGASKSDKLSLKAFFDQIHERLSPLSAEQLRGIFYEMGRRVDPEHRGAFLEQLQSPPQTDSLPATFILSGQLLREINSLTKQVEQAMEHPHPAVSADGGEMEPTSAYEEFSAPLESLFDRSEAAFDYGDFTLAREALAGLFFLLSREDELGRRLMAPATVHLVPARARYLRSVCETAPPEQRPARFWEALRRINSQLELHPPVSVSEVLHNSDRPFPDLNLFLDGLIQLLEPETDREADRLLREATQLRYGTVGLQELAHRQGLQHPRAWIDWLECLAQDQNATELMAAAQEALKVLPSSLAIRALAARHLHTAAVILHQPEVALTARWEAFTSVPSIQHLLDLWETANTPVVRQHWMARAAELVHDRNPMMLASPDADDVFLESDEALFASDPVMTRACALLLAGDWRAARAMADSEDVLGWSAGDSSQALVVPFFLMWLAGKSMSPLSPQVSQIWQNALTHAAGWGSGLEHLSQRLGKALVEAMATLTVTAEETEELQGWCIHLIQRRVNAIVSGLYRGAYQRAATLIVAAAEMLRARHHEAEAKQLLEETAVAHHRKRAFQQELAAARGQQF